MLVSNLMAEPPEVTCSCPLVLPAAGGKLFRAAATAAAADIGAFVAVCAEDDTMEAASCHVVKVVKALPTLPNCGALPPLP